MIQTIEAVIDENGQVRLLGEIHIEGPRRALVTVLEEPVCSTNETAVLSESALAEDWLRPEEDEAWAHLQ